MAYSTELLLDIGWMTAGSTPDDLTVSGDYLYFTTSDFYSTKGALWRTDGSEHGTIRLKNFEYQGVVRNLVAAEDELYFTWYLPGIGEQLWKSNGTPEGTVQVTSIERLAQSSQMTAAGDVVYFMCNTQELGDELWRSDGTAAGTFLLKDIRPGPTSSNIQRMTPVGNQLFFTADDGVYGTELWRSDGTTEGTVRITDLTPGSGSGNLGSLASFNGSLYFSAYPPDLQEKWGLWKSDGSIETTRLVKQSSKGLGSLAAIGVALYMASSEGGGTGIWVSDGTEAGTQLWAVVPVNSSRTQFYDGDGRVYLETNQYLLGTGTGLWTVDGTAEGTHHLYPLGLDERPPAGINGSLFFQARWELWRSDGTPEGTGALDIPTRQFSRAESFTRFGDWVYFTADDRAHGRELWRTDGTIEGTKLFVDLSTSNIGSATHSFTKSGGKVYFVGDDDPENVDHPEALGPALYVADGTPGGTRLVKDIVPGGYELSPTSLTDVNGRLYFISEGSLWTSDGTESGTIQLRAGDRINGAQYLTAVGDVAYFTFDDGVHGRELWKSDGTVNGTVIVADISPNGSSSPTNLVAVGDRLFFTAGHPETGREFWKSDGTADGTLLVGDLTPGPGDTVYWSIGAAGNRFLFARPTPEWNYDELWTSSGDPESTKLLREIRSMDLHSTTVFAGGMFAGQLVFAANTGSEYGTEIWRSDGTLEGTSPIRAIAPGSASWIRSPMTAIGDEIYFFTRPDFFVNDRWLWKTDGTHAGTVLVKEITTQSSFGSVVGANGDIFFTVGTGVGVGSRVDLWKIDANNTPPELILTYLRNDPSGSVKNDWLFSDGSNVYLAATDNLHGTEPRRLFSLANTPRVTHAVTFAGVQSQSGLTVRRNVADGSEVSHVKVTDIIRGTLFLHDGVTQVHSGDFVPFEETLLGLKFTPEDEFTGTASFKVQASTSASDDGLGGNVVTATITVFAALGTDNDDTLTLRASTDGTLLEVHRGNPPTPGTTPVFVWPMDANVPLPINTLGGNDKVFVELPPNSGGPVRGIRFERSAAADELHVTSGHVRLGGGVSVVADLTVSADAAIDVADGALIVDYTGTSPVATVREKILSGRGGPGFAAPWDGTGITSSTAAAGNAAEPEKWSVAYAENAALPLGPDTTFRGQAVDETAVLIAYTPTGDANLDGVVKDDDVTIVGATYAPGAPQPQWALGDFDYNGFVDDDDVTLLGAFYEPGAVAAAPPEYVLARFPDTYVMARSPDRAISSTAGLQSLVIEETFGPGYARGQAFDELGSTQLAAGSRVETRAQLEDTRAQPGESRAQQETFCDDDRLIDLLAESIAPTIAGRSATIDDTGLPRRLAGYRLELWPL